MHLIKDGLTTLGFISNSYLLYMRIFNILFVFTLILCSVACGEDSCARVDWLGAFNKQSENCSDSTIVFLEMVIITTGTAEGTININGVDVEVNENQCEIIVGNDVLTLEGSQIEITSGDCSAIYN